MSHGKYHLWNPFTVMEEFLPLLGIGPVVIARGEGPYVFNEKGKRYINGMSSLWNVAVGHGREELVEAATRQMRELAYASCFRQTHPRAMELAERLVEITGGRYGHVYLASNGSEAVEAALKMARQYHRQSEDPRDRNRHKIFSLKGSYHGVSYGTLSTSGNAADREKFGPLVPGFLQIDPPYCYRCPYGKERYPGCGLACASALESAIRAEGAETAAAFILEPVMGVLGVIEPPEEYFRHVGEICRRNGLLFIVDEVTTGFGRTGRLFASEVWKPEPDILCLGKGISSGYLPLAATLATGEIFRRFEGRGNQFDHGSTASGHPVCAAVGLKNIEIILREKLPENAAKTGNYLKSRLTSLAERHGVIGDVRGSGLMLGIELVKDRSAKTPLAEKKTFEIVLDTALLGLLLYYRGNVLGLLPPLITDRGVADGIMEVLEKSIDTGISAGIARKARMGKEFASSRLF